MAFVLSHPVSVTEPPVDPVPIVASPAERAALAAAYEVVSVDQLDAEATVTPGIGGSLLVEGRVRADIVQTCVVSLVPVAQKIDETFSVRFERPRHGGEAGEIVVNPDDPDPPEPLVGPTVDVGALVEESFALAIDPYPRAPGAELPAAPTDDAAEDGSPFAALAGLVRREGGED